MSRNPPSNANSHTSNKRVAIQDPSEDNAVPPTGILTQPTKSVKKISPTDAALRVKNDSIATLHKSIQRLVDEEITPVLTALLNAKSEQNKADKMLKEDAPIPSSVAKLARKWRLEATDRVMDKQEFQTLSNRGAEILERCRKELGKLIGEAKQLTAEDLWEEFIELYCEFLPFLVDNAMEQLNIQNYPDMLAAIDLIHEKTDDIIGITKLTLEKFLTLFKKHNKLAVLPLPSNPSAREAFITTVNRINSGDGGNGNSLLQIEAGEMDTSTANTTGRVVMVNKTMTMLKGLLFDPFDEFNGGKKKNDETSRLSAYADRKRRERKANRCAEIIASIPPVDNPTLKGAAKKAADERMGPLERRVQSLEDRDRNRNLNSNGSERNNAARKQTKSRGKPMNQQKKGGKGKNGRGDKNNDSGGGKGRRGKGHSNKESNARRQNSRTEMRK